jgi:NADH-quinone oxidoreductase subunit G
MCDEGRFDYRYINERERLRGPLVREGDAQRPAPWETVLPVVRHDFLAVAAKDGSSVAAVLSPYLTCEEAYLLAKFIKGLSKDARLYLGLVPVRGEDDTYPKDRKGRPIQPVKFTIRAEKCPNRRGVEEILKHFQGEVLYFDRALEQAAAGALQALYLTGGYPPRFGEWLPAPVVASLKNVPVLVVQDLMPSTGSAAAKYVLPAASFAEKDGCFVNHANLAQAIYWAVRPMGLGRTDGQVFLDLMERRGLLHAETLRRELAAEVPFFAGLKDGSLGDHGIRL